MIRTLVALFQRYAATHLQVRGPGFTLTDGAGRQIGAVDTVALEGARVHLTGWVIAQKVMLLGGPMQATAYPGIRREDVARQLTALGEAEMASDARVGFEVEMPRPALSPTQPLMLLITPHGADAQSLPLIFAVPLPGGLVRQARLAAGFGVRLVRLVPDILRWRMHRDIDARARIKRGLGLDPVARAGALDRRVLLDGTPPANTPAPGPITIVLPVYNAFDLLAEALDRVVAHTDLPWHLIAIEDGSTDDRVRPWLRDRLAQPDMAERSTLIENPENLGFIGAVNAGLARATERGNDVVLLNTDAFVPAGWASRLLRPMAGDSSVATVTPMSNDAEIFSVPTLCQRAVLLPGMGDAIDAVAATLDPVAGQAEAPTGVGFCMAVSAHWLRRLPALDTAFGRGYGEEVDWCQKARAKGGRHIGISNLFVEHRGGTSFGSEAKLKLVAENNAIISRRYPAYDGQVQQFIGSDPLCTPRLALAVAWAAAWSQAHDDLGDAAAIPVYLAHSLGGGADIWLDGQIAADLAALGRPSVVLRVGGPVRWQIEVTGPDGVTAGTTEDFDLICALLAPLKLRRLIYSCGVGDYDPVTLPGGLLHLSGRTVAQPDLLPHGRGSRATGSDLPVLNRAPIEVLFHDFYPVSPGYTLLDSAGVYHGPLAPGSAAHRAAVGNAGHSVRRPDGRSVGLSDWQAAWAPVMKQASRVTVFSADSRMQVIAAYPDADGHVVVQPHALPLTPPVIGAAPGPGRVIGVLGNIGFQKGAGLLGDLATALSGRADLGLCVIGNVDPSYPLPAAVPIHGTYRIEDLPGLVARYGVTHWLIPSIWPETFSYTTHEALATGMPVLAFDIGGQGDAVRAAQNGIAVPFGAPGDLVGHILAALDAPSRPASTTSRQPAQADA